MEQLLGLPETYKSPAFIPSIRQNGDIKTIIRGAKKLLQYSPKTRMELYGEIQQSEKKLKDISLDTVQRILGILYESSPLKLRESRLREYHIQLERRKNKEFFDINKNEIYTKHHGKYIVIADGKTQAVGETFDEVKNVAIDANHRFIFKVEEIKKEIIRLRWR